MLAPTIPETFVRGVLTKITEATFKGMLDTILGARALLHILHLFSTQLSQHPLKKNKT